MRRPYKDSEEEKRWPRDQRNADGNRICRFCKTELVAGTGRTQWCNNICENEVFRRVWWNGARHFIILRDKGICQLCGVDTREHKPRTGALVPYEIDHIVPLSEGGKLCDPDNLRLLCLPCHKKETAALAKRTAKTRRIQRKHAAVTKLFTARPAPHSFA